MTTIPGPPAASDTAPKQPNRASSAAVSSNRSVLTPAPPATGGSGGRAVVSKHICEPRSLWEGQPIGSGREPPSRAATDRGGRSVQATAWPKESDDADPPGPPGPGRALP